MSARAFSCRAVYNLVVRHDDWTWDHPWVTFLNNQDSSIFVLLWMLLGLFSFTLRQSELSGVLQLCVAPFHFENMQQIMYNFTYRWTLTDFKTAKVQFQPSVNSLSRPGPLDNKVTPQSSELCRERSVSQSQTHFIYVWHNFKTHERPRFMLLHCAQLTLSRWNLSTGSNHILWRLSLVRHGC